MSKHKDKRWYKSAVKKQEEINPFDLLSGKVVQNGHGTFWFKEPGKNICHDGTPIKENLHRIDGPAAVYKYKSNKRHWFVNGVGMFKKVFYAKFGVITLKDLTDGKVVQNHYGTFWFKEAGYNVENNGRPIKENLHRIDGPAIVWPNGVMESYINGVKYTESEFKKKLKCLQN